MIGLAVYGVGTVIAHLRAELRLLLAAARHQGMGGAAIARLARAIVRDRL